MKDGYKKQKWTTAAGASAASYLEMLLRENFDEKMESLINIHPILRMYFDSDLSSEIENNAFLAISDAIFTIADAFTNKGAFSHFNVIGMTFAHIICKRLYLLKLLYHANSGRITKQQFCKLSAKDLAVETATLLNTVWDFLGKELPKYLNVTTKSLSGWLAAYCNVEPTTVFMFADTISGIFSKLHPKLKEYITPEKIEKQLSVVIDFTLTAARKVLIFKEKMTEKVKYIYHSVESILKSWMAKIELLFRFSKQINVDVNGDVIIDTGSELIIDNEEQIGEQHKKHIEVVTEKQL